MQQEINYEKGVTVLFFTMQTIRSAAQSLRHFQSYISKTIWTKLMYLRDRSYKTAKQVIIRVDLN